MKELFLSVSFSLRESFFIVNLRPTVCLFEIVKTMHFYGAFLSFSLVSFSCPVLFLFLCFLSWYICVLLSHTIIHWSTLVLPCSSLCSAYVEYTHASQLKGSFPLMFFSMFSLLLILRPYTISNFDIIHNTKDVDIFIEVSASWRSRQLQLFGKID